MLQVASDPIVERFFAGLKLKIGHHMRTVEDVMPALAGFTMLYGKDFEFFGAGTTNLSSFVSRRTGIRYVLARSQCGRKVAVRVGTQQGPARAEFDNTTSNAIIHGVFKAL